MYLHQIRPAAVDYTKQTEHRICLQPLGSVQAQWHGNFQVSTENWTKFFRKQSLPCGHYHVLSDY
jgi:hypothetical protein